MGLQGILFYFIAALFYFILHVRPALCACQHTSGLVTCVISDVTTLSLYCRHCNVVQREPATSKPGEDSTHLVGVETAGRES